MYESRETQLEHEVYRLKGELAKMTEAAEHNAKLIRDIDQAKQPMLEKIDKLQGECTRLKALNNNLVRQMDHEQKSHERLIKKIESRWAYVYIALVLLIVLCTVNLIF